MVLSLATMELLQQDCLPMHHADKKGARWLCGFIHASIYVLLLNLIIMEPAQRITLLITAQLVRHDLVFFV